MPVMDLGRIVVAVDGTSGSGKSSTCRGVAEQLGLRYLDTGAMFRAVTWWMLEHDVDVHDPEAVAARVDEVELASGTDPRDPTISVDGTDVSAQIRTDEVTRSVSPVSTVPAVRSRLLDLQRQIIAPPGRPGGGIVVEGRDIGSTVAPDAAVKIYLVADPAARAARRAAETGSADSAATELDLARRDRIDSTRAVSPLVQSEGAVLVDGTHLTLDEVIDTIVGIVRTAE